VQAGRPALRRLFNGWIWVQWLVQGSLRAPLAMPWMCGRGACSCRVTIVRTHAGERPSAVSRASQVPGRLASLRGRLVRSECAALALVLPPGHRCRECEGARSRAEEPELCCCERGCGAPSCSVRGPGALRRRSCQAAVPSVVGSVGLELCWTVLIGEVATQWGAGGCDRLAGAAINAGAVEPQGRSSSR